MRPHRPAGFAGVVLALLVQVSGGSAVAQTSGSAAASWEGLLNSGEYWRIVDASPSGFGGSRGYAEVRARALLCLAAQEFAKVLTGYAAPADAQIALAWWRSLAALECCRSVQAPWDGERLGPSPLLTDEDLGRAIVRALLSQPPGFCLAPRYVDSSPDGKLLYVLRQREALGLWEVVAISTRTGQVVTGPQCVERDLPAYEDLSRDVRWQGMVLSGDARLLYLTGPHAYIHPDSLILDTASLAHVGTYTDAQHVMLPGPDSGGFYALQRSNNAAHGPLIRAATPLPDYRGRIGPFDTGSGPADTVAAPTTSADLTNPGWEAQAYPLYMTRDRETACVPMARSSHQNVGTRPVRNLNVAAFGYAPFSLAHGRFTGAVRADTLTMAARGTAEPLTVAPTCRAIPAEGIMPGSGLAWVYTPDHCLLVFDPGELRLLVRLREDEYGLGDRRTDKLNYYPEGGDAFTCLRTRGPGAGKPALMLRLDWGDDVFPGREEAARLLAARPDVDWVSAFRKHVAQFDCAERHLLLACALLGAVRTVGGSRQLSAAFDRDYDKLPRLELPAPVPPKPAPPQVLLPAPWRMAHRWVCPSPDGTRLYALGVPQRASIRDDRRLPFGLSVWDLPTDDVAPPRHTPRATLSVAREGGLRAWQGMAIEPSGAWLGLDGGSGSAAVLGTDPPGWRCWLEGTAQARVIPLPGGKCLVLHHAAGVLRGTDDEVKRRRLELYQIGSDPKTGQTSATNLGQVQPLLDRRYGFDPDPVLWREDGSQIALPISMVWGRGPAAPAHYAFAIYDVRQHRLAATIDDFLTPNQYWNPYSKTYCYHGPRVVPVMARFPWCDLRWRHLPDGTVEVLRTPEGARLLALNEDEQGNHGAPYWLSTAWNTMWGMGQASGGGTGGGGLTIMVPR